jgi:hypothetical protein
MKTKLDPVDIEMAVAQEDYHRFPGTTVTVCCLTLRNGYNAIGQSACVDPANFDEQVGKDLARRDALNQVWRLEGYLLKDQLSRIYPMEAA